MAFHDAALFPPRISYGSVGGPGHATINKRSPGGRRHAVKRGGVRPLRSYTVQWRQPRSNAADVLRFVLAREGSAYGFRFWDWTDFSTNTNPITEVIDGEGGERQTIGTGDGSTVRFPLVRTYQDSGAEVVRRIEKPMRLSEAHAIGGEHDEIGFLSGATASTIHRVWVDDVAQTLDVDVSIDYATGELVFATAPDAAAVIEWGGYYVVPVVFSEETDRMLGMIAPQNAWREFEEITLHETQQDSTLVALERDPGGARYITLGAAATQVIFEFVNGAMQRIDGDACAVDPDLILPAPAAWMLGGPLFRITNAGSLRNIEVKWHDTTSLLTLAPGYTAEFYLAPNAAGDGYDWIVA